MLRFALDERTRIRAAVHLQNIDLDKCIYMANEIVQQVLGMKDMAGHRKYPLDIRCRPRFHGARIQTHIRWQAGLMGLL